MVDWIQLSHESLWTGGKMHPFKRQRLTEWIKTCNPTLYCLQETYFKYKDTCKESTNSCINVRVSRLQSKESYQGWRRALMIKGSILIGDVTILNRYVPNSRALNYLKQNQIELQGETDESIVIIGDLSTPLLQTDWFSQQKGSENIVDLNSTINQVDVIDTYRQLHPTGAENTFFSSSGPWNTP